MVSDDDMLPLVRPGADGEPPGFQPPALPEPAAEDDDVLADDGEEAPPVVFIHRITKRMAGARLDKFLRERHPRISRTTLQRYIKEGQVTIGGAGVKPSYEILAGDEVQVTLPPPPTVDVIPEDIPLDILYEDQWLMVINKQIGIVCHPGFPGQHGTIANAVMFHAGRVSAGSDPFRPGIVHRLDKNTTGVMLIAKCDEAHWRISRQFERRTTQKEYFAICEGRIALDGDVINRPLAPHPDTTRRMVLARPGPLPRQAMFKEAVTEYRVLKRYRGFTTVALFPKTGRTHQLRVHMMSIGHPILGDTYYGGHWVSERDLTGAGGTEPLCEFQALHARRLRVMHPFLDQPLEIEAPLPARLTRIVELLEAHRPAER